MDNKSIKKLEADLWEAADLLRQGSKLTSQQYCMPVLGLLFLRYAYSRFKKVEEEILKDRPVRNGRVMPVEASDFAEKSALYLPKEAQYSYLVNLPEDIKAENIVAENGQQMNSLGEVVNHAMELVEAQSEQLAGVLPKEYTNFADDLLAELLRIFNNNALDDVGGDVIGRIYEYFLSKFAPAVASDDGVFFSMRNDLLAYYPERVYRRKLAYELVRMSQTGQYNFSRCLKRGDKVTAQMYLAEFMEHTLHVLFLLNKKYAPYKKWLMKAASTRLTILPEVTDILIAISDMDLNDDNICSSIEIIAQLVLNELKNQGHVIAFNRRDPYFLEPYGQEIATSINYLPDETNVKADSMKNRHADLVDQIVVAEWEAFDKVINEGGRADCQDNWDTFSKMRKSQYLTWSIEMLESFLADMKQADENGWNLITEKYARMEESTAYDHYVQIADKLPKKDDKTKAIVEEIVKIQVGFMEDFAEDYPKVAGTARKIHTYEDTPYDTSYETYLRGELLTYSPKTLELYGRYVVDHVNKENNIAKEIMTNTALLYGYKSLEDLESKLD